MRTKRAFVIVSLLGMVFGGSAAWAAAGSGTHDTIDPILDPNLPADPSWVNPDGTITDLPATVPLMDANGNIVGNVDPSTYIDETDLVIRTDETPETYNAGMLPGDVTEQPAPLPSANPQVCWPPVGPPFICVGP